MEVTFEPRISMARFTEVAPAITAAARELSRAIGNLGLEPDLTEIVKVRCSQINGCAFCIDLHQRMLGDLGVSNEKRSQIETWRNSELFSDRERSALAWAETVTLLAEDHVPDDAYLAARAAFNEEELTALTAAIGMINYWNRIAAAFRFAPRG